MEENEIKELEEWFNSQAGWIKYGTNLLIKHNVLTDELINNIADVCLKKKRIPKEEITISSIIKQNKGHSIHINSIEGVQGIFGLAPKKKLDFSEKNMAIVYGQNGSGKSSYVRLLKNVCNSRTKEEIFGNIYNEKNPDASADIQYLYDGEDKKITWTKNNNISDLSYVDIYDSKYSDLFIKNATTVTYEPPILTFFSSLVDMVSQVKERITLEKDKNTSFLPKFPQDLDNTTPINWFKTLSWEITENELENNTLFTEEDNEKYLEIQNRLNVKDSKIEIDKFNKQLKYLREIEDNLQLLQNKISLETYRIICSLHSVCLTKQKTSKAASEQVFSKGQLDGLGEDTWKALWQAARAFSEGYAYKSKSFPFVDDGARCVLCHQILNEEAKHRMNSFETYVKGFAEKEYQDALAKYNDYVQKLPVIDDIELWETRISAAGILDETLRDLILEKVKDFSLKKQKILKMEDICENVNISQIKSLLNDKISKCEEQKNKYKEDEEKNNNEQLKNQISELSAKKWLHENKELIQQEIERLKIIENFDNILKTVNTRTLTSKKAELSETLITEEFVKRFQKELHFFNVHINVEFKKDKSSAGRITHSIILRDSKSSKKVLDVLSDGEYRIISIAAFFADVLGRTGDIPFIFDDPISSLDSDYEEAVARRLIALSRNRQIIVFTHRISFMTLLQNDIKEGDVSCNTICIRSEPWGKGEPSEISLAVKNTKNALRNIKNEKIPKLKKSLLTDGSENYEIDAKAMCSNIRILLERIIEENLLSGVVTRFRRSIQTTNRLYKVAFVSKEDCRKFDELMTKYSRYEHSQSNELIVNLPTPDDFESDITQLLDWIEHFETITKY